MTHVRATFIADALRRGGVSVVEMPGWKKRGRPLDRGSFDPRAIMFHHDASAKGPSPGQAKSIAKVGRPSENVPPPTAHCWVDTDGVWHVLAAGRACHAGVGAGFGRIPRDCGNTFAIGVETDHTAFGEHWAPGQLKAIKLGFAALADAMQIDPMTSICGHKEYTDRKIDPSRVDMDKFRADVAVLIDTLGTKRSRAPMRRLPATAATVDLSRLREAANTDPGAAEGHVTHKGDVTLVEQALAAEGLRAPVFVDGSFGTKTVAAYRMWQLNCGLDDRAASGFPDLMSLTKLGQRHDFRVRR